MTYMNEKYNEISNLVPMSEQNFVPDVFRSWEPLSKLICWLFYPFPWTVDVCDNVACLTSTQKKKYIYIDSVLFYSFSLVQRVKYVGRHLCSTLYQFFLNFIMLSIYFLRANNQFLELKLSKCSIHWHKEQFIYQKICYSSKSQVTQLNSRKSTSF